jgi:hypothetical protein
MGNKLSSLEIPLLDVSIKREEKETQKNAFDREEEKTENSFNMLQREAFDTIFQDKLYVLKEEASMVNDEIDKLRFLQVREGGNRVITDKVLLERMVTNIEELDRIRKLRRQYVFINHYHAYGN